MVLIPGRHRFELLDTCSRWIAWCLRPETDCLRPTSTQLHTRIDYVRPLGSRGIILGSDMENKMALLYKASPNNAYSHYLPPTGKSEHTALKSTTRYLQKS